jgi:hypothetical protein
MLDSKLFTFDKASKTITSELSTLMHDPANSGHHSRPALRRFNDGAWGLGIINAKTRNATEWYIDTEERSSEGDIVSYNLKPTHRTLKKHPNLSGWMVYVFND